MPPTTSYSFGDIVLVPFPFTDQSAAKRRPAVVVSTERYSRGTLGEVQVKDWKSAGLIKPSVVKPVVTTIEHTLVIRRLGRLKEEDQQRLSPWRSSRCSRSSSRSRSSRPNCRGQWSDV